MSGKRVYNSTTHKKVLINLVLVLCFLTFTKIAKSQMPAEHLFSETVGLHFYKIAHEISKPLTQTNSDELSITIQQESDSELNQALLFLYATNQIDSRSSYVLPNMLSIASRTRSSNQETGVTNSLLNNRLLIIQLLLSYIDSSSDFLVLRETVENALARLDSREEREQFIQGLLASGLLGKNNRFDSYLITQLGLYMAEKNDMQTATNYLLEAYNMDNYNQLAFSKLAEAVPDQIQPTIYLVQLRLKLLENPLNLPAALDFAQFAERLQLYDLAAEGYSYCADLFKYLYPQENLPSSIYLPWALSYYNTERNQYKAVQIADSITESGRFDLILLSIAAKAAEKVSDTQKANQLLQATEKFALRQHMENPNPIIAEQLAWFYSFVNIQPMKAIDWANKAFSNDPNSISAASLLAYTLLENGQRDLVKSLIDNYPPNQITELTHAKIAVAEGNTESASEHLKSAIEKDPASLEAELAKQILEQQGGQYISGIDADLTIQMLQEELNTSVVPQFITPENIISVSINMRGSKFTYGTPLDGYVVITNNSSEQLIISDNSLFKGNIRVDATITGDINFNIPNLITKRVVPSLPRNLLIPIQLFTGQLRNILKTYPQASLEIELTAYIDPVIEVDGTVSNNIKQIIPASVTFLRPRIDLTRKYLQNRLDTMATGRQGQKNQTAQLFIGLLREQNAMNNQQLSYKYMYSDWMPELLRSALIETVLDTDWVVKSNAMAEMLSLGLDYELTNAVAENLNDNHWPVRLMALYLLAKSQDSKFNKVLDWHAEHDVNAIVRDMAVALGGKKPDLQITPQQQQTPLQSSPLDDRVGEILNRSRRLEPPSEEKPTLQQAPAQQIPSIDSQDGFLESFEIVQPSPEPESEPQP
jgi:tetratricopeptide (TPR) repeat protein